MKRIIPFFLALFLLPGVLSAREVVRLTRFGGETITGVAASHMFKVELIKSDQTRAVVELDADLERYLRFERGANGMVSVKLVIPDGERRRFDRNNGWRGRILKMTVYLPDIQNITLEDMSHLTTGGVFDVGQVKIEVDDMARIDNLGLRAQSVEIDLDGMASAQLSLEVESLTVEADGMAKFSARGKARRVQVESDGMANINTAELSAERAHVEADGMAKTQVSASQYLYGRTENLASIHYAGEPSEVDLKTPTRTIRTKTN